MADKMRKSNVVFGDPRYKNYVSVTRSTQSSVANSGKGVAAQHEREAEREKVASMKRALQASTVQLGDDSLDERTWRSTNKRDPYSRAEATAARGELDPAVSARIRKSNVKLGCERVQKPTYTSVSHSAHAASAPVTGAALDADREKARQRKLALTGSSITSW